MEQIIFRKMTMEDIDGVVQVENDAFHSPWSRQAFCDEVHNDMAHYVLAVCAEKVIGYVGMWFIMDEAHITNVAVLSTYRKQGIGKAMMDKAIQMAIANKAVSMTLEVRPSNQAAIHLYKKLGFTEAGLRKNYYEDTHEDALIMWLHDMQKK